MLRVFILSLCKKNNGGGGDILELATRRRQTQIFKTSRKAKITYEFLFQGSDALQTYPTPLHPCHLLLQRCIFAGEQLGLAFQLLPPGTLTGELRLEGVERLPQRRLLFLLPPDVGGLGAVRGFICVVAAQRWLSASI